MAYNQQSCFIISMPYPAMQGLSCHVFANMPALLCCMRKVFFGILQVQNPWKTIVSRRYRPQLVLAAASTFFQQWTGINTIIFYAPQLFVSLGQGEGAALAATIVTGIVNHLATYVSFSVADKYGRRPLFIEGTVSVSRGVALHCVVLCTCLTVMQ